MLTIGTKVKAPFANRPDCYYVGTVVGHAVLGGADRCVVEVETEVWEGKEYDPQKRVDFPSVSVVEVIG